MSAFDIARIGIKRGAIQKPLELQMLTASVMRLKPETVVEIGTYHGGTMYCWAYAAVPGALLVGIDLPADAPGAYGMAELQERVQQHLMHNQRVELIRADSHELSTKDELEEILDGRMIDFLFIDGDHSYEGVKADFEDYEDLVRDGGMIAFHDVLPHNKYAHCHVDQFWKELRPQYELTRIFCDTEAASDWGGIGVIYQGSKRG